MASGTQTLHAKGANAKGGKAPDKARQGLSGSIFPCPRVVWDMGSSKGFGYVYVHYGAGSMLAAGALQPVPQIACICRDSFPKGFQSSPLMSVQR